MYGVKAAAQPPPLGSLMFELGASQKSMGHGRGLAVRPSFQGTEGMSQRRCLNNPASATCLPRMDKRAGQDRDGSGTSSKVACRWDYRAVQQPKRPPETLHLMPLAVTAPRAGPFVTHRLTALGASLFLAHPSLAFWLAPPLPPLCSSQGGNLIHATKPSA